jgi:hypothetical protein
MPLLDLIVVAITSKAWIIHPQMTQMTQMAVVV